MKDLGCVCSSIFTNSLFVSGPCVYRQLELLLSAMLVQEIARELKGIAEKIACNI